MFEDKPLVSRYFHLMPPHIDSFLDLSYADVSSYRDSQADLTPSHGVIDETRISLE